jgi:iron complex outermembrane receptor protein
LAGLTCVLVVAARRPLTAQDPPPPPPPPPAAQQVATAGVSGIVTAAQDSLPLMGVQVVIRGTRRWAITNQEGAFRLEGLKPGGYVIEFRHPNRAPVVYNLTLEPAQVTDLAVRIDTRTVALPEVVVEGRETQPAVKMTDFLARKSAGHGGYFITRKEIDDRQPRVLSDMMRRVPGLRVDCDFGTCHVVSFTEARRLGGWAAAPSSISWTASPSRATWTS